MFCVKMLSGKFCCHWFISFVFLITLLWEHGVLTLKLFAGFVLFSLVYVDFQMGNTVATFSS